MSKETPHRKYDRISARKVGQMLGVSHDFVKKLPIKHIAMRSGKKVQRRYLEQDVLDYIATNTEGTAASPACN